MFQASRKCFFGDWGAVLRNLSGIVSIAWNYSDCNWTRTHNHLVHKRTLNHLANHLAFQASLAKWLSIRL